MELIDISSIDNVTTSSKTNLQGKLYDRTFLDFFVVVNIDKFVDPENYFTNTRNIQCRLKKTICRKKTSRIFNFILLKAAKFKCYIQQI